MDPAEARELLSNAMSQDAAAGISPMSGADGGSDGPSFGNNPTPSNQSTSEVAGTTESSDSLEFTNFDLNSVPAEHRPYVEQAYKTMQAGLTQKFQELAETRKQFEGVDPSAAREALQFVEAIQTDPNYALAVNQALTEQLQAAGYSPAQAQELAGQQMEQFNNSEDDGWGDETYGAVPPEVQRKLDELEAWKGQQEQQQRQQYWENKLTNDAAAIRAAHPHYSEDDMNDIFALSWSTGGDLQAAQKAFEAQEQRIVSRYLQEKAGVPAGQPISGGPAETPTIPRTMAEGHAMALEHWRQAKANGEF